VIVLFLVLVKLIPLVLLLVPKLLLLLLESNPSKKMFPSRKQSLRTARHWMI
jgi:hypothetical protein